MTKMSSSNKINSWPKKNSGLYTILAMWTKLLKSFLVKTLALTREASHSVFQQSKAEEVDNMVEHIDETLNYIGDWEPCKISI
jgi:hypothetical protein